MIFKNVIYILEERLKTINDWIIVNEREETIKQAELNVILEKKERVMKEKEELTKVLEILKNGI